MKKYPMFNVHVKTNEALIRIKDVLSSKFTKNSNAPVKQLTESFKVRMKTQNIILTNNCTASLTIALRLAGVDYLDDVISTPIASISTNMSIATLGADIIWADVDESTGCISVDDVENLLKKINVKAVVATTWLGLPPNLEKLQKLCVSYDVKLILDASDAMCATFMDKELHKWADFTCYNLQVNKHITCGEGGILICDNDDDYILSKKLKMLGVDQKSTDVEKFGYEFNMNNLSASVGLSQLPYIDGIIESHRINSSTYDSLFKDFHYVKCLNPNYQCSSSYLCYTIILNNELIDREKLLLDLNNEGINAGIVYNPCQGYSCFDKFYKRTLSGVVKFSTTQISLPVGWWLDENDIKHIASRVKILCEKQLTNETI